MNKIKEKIFEFLKKQNKPLTQAQIVKALNSNKAVVSKYVAVLEAEGKIKVERHGNISLITVKK